MRISNWSSDVCSSDLGSTQYGKRDRHRRPAAAHQQVRPDGSHGASPSGIADLRRKGRHILQAIKPWRGRSRPDQRLAFERSEEHTSELQSLMRNSYAVFCLKKKKKKNSNKQKRKNEQHKQ